MRLINVSRLIRKAGVALALVAGGAVLLGPYGEPVRGAAVDAFRRATFSFDTAVFSPSVDDDALAQLRAIDQVTESLAPRIERAEILVRKQRAEIAYLNELSGFLEERLSTEQVEAARAVAVDPQAQIPECFGQCQRTWVGHQRRVAALELSLESVLRLSDRVAALREQLENRRERVLALAPGDGATHQPRSETEEVEMLLADVHESLFKTLHSLDQVTTASATGM